jgi:hypothetical protein
VRVCVCAGVQVCGCVCVIMMKMKIKMNSDSEHSCVFIWLLVSLLTDEVRLAGIDECAERFAAVPVGGEVAHRHARGACYLGRGQASKVRESQWTQMR